MGKAPHRTASRALNPLQCQMHKPSQHLASSHRAASPAGRSYLCLQHLRLQPDWTRIIGMYVGRCRGSVGGMWARCRRSRSHHPSSDNSSPHSSRRTGLHPLVAPCRTSGGGQVGVRIEGFAGEWVDRIRHRAGCGGVGDSVGGGGGGRTGRMLVLRGVGGIGWVGMLVEGAGDSVGGNRSCAV